MAVEVTMIQTQRAAPDGITIETYKQGETYTVRDDIGDLLVKGLGCSAYKNGTNKIEMTLVAVKAKRQSKGN